MSNHNSLARLAGFGLIDALVWVGMDAFLHLRLRPLELISVLACWWLCAGIAEITRLRWPRAGWAAYGIASALPLVLVSLFNSTLRYSISVGALCYAAFAVGVARALWSLSMDRQQWTWSEFFRRALVIIASVWALWPFFSDRQMGGIDARWYGYMLADFLQQSRAGVFPVFLGQGDFAYNGAVHPFRTAPLHLWIGGLWDVFTLRALGSVSIQHLVAITCGFAASLGMYRCLRSRNPAQSWFAAVLSAAYVLSPAILGPLYKQDMYMTFAAIAVLPMLLLSNVRAAVDCALRNLAMLAASLALLWMAHPPSAVLGTLVTLFFQLSAWTLRGDSIGNLIRSGLIGGACFVSFGAYYFASMSELPKMAGDPALPDLLLVASLTGAWICASLTKGAAKISVFVCAVLIVAGLSFVSRAWVLWACVFLGCNFAVWLRWPDLTARIRMLSLIGFLVLGSLVAGGLAKNLGAIPNEAFLMGKTEYAAQWYRAFFPLARDLLSPWDNQPGLAIAAAVMLALFVGFRRHPLGFVLGFISFMIFGLLIGLPGVADFLVGFAPNRLGYIAGIPLAMRIFPIAAAAAVLAGFLVFGTMQSRTRAVVFCFMIVLLAWSGWEARRFVQRGNFATSTRPHSARIFMPENVVLDRYAYDLLPIPEYFSNGITDRALLSRILDQGFQPVVGPDQLARIMEKGGVETVEMTARGRPEAKEWLSISPRTSVAPGEKLILRFEFDHSRAYNGYLIGQSAFRDYREYGLPRSGDPKSFGSTAESSKVVAIGNSGDYVVEYQWEHFKTAGNTLDEHLPSYATLHLSRYKATDSPIHLKSLVPYLASVRSETSGYLETPRVFLPGYEATVDGKPVQVVKSNQRLVAVPITPGVHEVAVKYVGTTRLWCGVWLSAIAWATWGLLLVRQVRLRKTEATE